MITETDQVAKALDDAAKRWPEERDSRGKLLLHLVDEGHHALVEEAGRRRKQRLAATQILLGAADVALGISPLTLAEVFVDPARAGMLDAAQLAIGELDIVTVALGEDAPVRLAALWAVTRLRLPDCCVLLAAESAAADVATFDDRLASSADDLGRTVWN